MKKWLAGICLMVAAFVSPVLAAGPLRESRPAPRFEVRSVEGKPVSLDALLKQGPVLIDFWATWCKPCVTSLPAVERLYQQHRAAGLTVVAVSIDGPRNFAKVRPFARSLGLTFPVVLDEDGSLARRYDVTSVPTSILVAPDRRIVHVQIGYTAGQEALLERAILELLPSAAATDTTR